MNQKDAEALRDNLANQLPKGTKAIVIVCFNCDGGHEGAVTWRFTSMGAGEAIDRISDVRNGAIRDMMRDPAAEGKERT